MDVIFNGQILRLTEHFGKPCLFIRNSSQTDMPKMRFVGGYPDEYCIYLSDLTQEELASITDMDGNAVDVYSVLEK